MFKADPEPRHTVGRLSAVNSPFVNNALEERNDRSAAAATLHITHNRETYVMRPGISVRSDITVCPIRVSCLRIMLTGFTLYSVESATTLRTPMSRAVLTMVHCAVIICPDRFNRIVLANGHLLERRRMNDVINPLRRHGATVLHPLHPR